MKYCLGYKEFIIKSDNNAYIKEASGNSTRAELTLTNRNLIVFFRSNNDYEDSLKIYPVEYIRTYYGRAQINTGGGNQPFFEIQFPDSCLYVFFGHSIKRAWQLQAEGRVQQWVTAINDAVDKFNKLKTENNITAQQQSQINNSYIYTESSTPNPSFCPGCGSPLSQDDVFCVVCGRRV